jgi:hypothetical protein
MKKKINESLPGSMTTRGDFTRGIPFYGTKGDFNFTMGRSNFTPGISIKQAPLTDMSRKGDPGFSAMDRYLGNLKFYFKPGDRVRGIKVNSNLQENPKVVIGKICKIKPNYSNDSIRVWIKDQRTLKVQEIYVGSMQRIYEDVALSFNQFIQALYD